MKTISDLRDVLGRTMEGVLDGSYSVEQARAVAQVAQEVNATAKLEIDMARATDGDFKGSGFIEVDPGPAIVQRKLQGRSGGGAA